MVDRGESSLLLVGGLLYHRATPLLPCLDKGLLLELQQLTSPSEVSPPISHMSQYLVRLSKEATTNFKKITQTFRAKTQFQY